MDSDARQNLLLDASPFFDSPELSDLTIVLVEEADGTQERAAKRHRAADGANGAQDAAEAEAAEAEAERPTLRLHGHKFLLSASSSVLKARIANWSEGDGNELVLHVRPM
jgi:hypothetical protein